MTFVYPTLLLALILGIIPILIYYLIRFRSLRVDWGATYVLERALERMKKKVYLEQLLLLLLRVLVMLLLVVVFARPVSKQRSGAVTGGGAHRIVVLDASYSMLAGETGATTWDKALTAARELVGSWGRGERWSLYLLGSPARWVVDDQVVDTPERTRAKLDGLAPSETTASLAQALAAVLQKTGGRDTEIYIVADAQAVTWKDVENLALPTGGAVRFFWLHPGAAGTANLAVTQLRLSHERILLRHPCRAFVSVRNFGTETAENAELEVLVDGAFFAREQVTLLPGQEVVTHVDVAFDEAGSHAVSARLRKDVLEFDNSAAAGVEAVPALSVFVLRDPGKTDKFASAWGLLDLAAKVMTRKNGEDVPLFTGGLLSARLLEAVPNADALSGADAVVLDGGCTLTPTLVQSLNTYVRNGGGLVLAADDSIDLKQWNEQLGRAGLLPAPLLAIRREALGGERFRSLSRSNLELPALKALETTEDGDVTRSRLYSWTELGEPVEGATVLARFAEGQAFAMEKRFGPGAVVLLASGLNSRNNNLLVREFTFPLLFNVLSEAAAVSQEPRTVATRQALRLRLREPEAPTTVQFTLGQQPPQLLTPQETRGGRIVELAEGCERSGLGSLLLTWKDRHQRVWFGVQGERTDSDLRPLEPAAHQRVTEHLQLTEAPGWDELKAQLEAGYHGAEWHHWAALALLVALLGEMLLQRRFI